MGTNSQSTTTIETEGDVHSPARCNDDTAVCIASVKGLKENWQKWSSEQKSSYQLQAAPWWESLFLDRLQCVYLENENVSRLVSAFGSKLWLTEPLIWL